MNNRDAQLKALGAAEERARIRKGVTEWGGGMLDSDDVLDVIDQESQPLTPEAIKGMSRQEINDDWERVQATLAGESPSATAGYDPSFPITADLLRVMPQSEHIRRKPEIDDFLSRGGPA